METYLWEINQIYDTYNIYKCILIVQSSCLKPLYDLLQKHDYPVATKYELKNFINDHSRILLIDINEAKCFNNKVDCLDKDEINMIICIDNEIKLHQFENVHHIFL